MAITRRQFIQRTGLATAGTLLGPSLFENLFVRQAMADTIGNRYLVVLYLDGGNDGLNTVTPYASGALRSAYDGYRRTNGGGINLSQGSLAGTTIGTDPATGTQLALHPGFSGLKQLYDLGKVAVVQGCGYPELQPLARRGQDHLADGEPARGSARTPAPAGSDGTWPSRASTAATTCPASASPARWRPSSGRPRPACSPSTRLENFGFPYDDFGGNSEQNRKRDGLPGALQRGRRRVAAHPQLRRRQRRRDAPQQRELPAGERPVGDRSLAGDPGCLRQRRPQHGARPA